MSETKSFESPYDLSGSANALTIALPVLSACGVEVPLPTAILSANTDFRLCAGLFRRNEKHIDH